MTAFTSAGSEARPVNLFLAPLALALTLLLFPAQAQTWGALATISETMGVSDSRICLGEASRGDIGCPSYAPSISPTGRINASAGITVDSVSLTTVGTTWGYLGSGSSYLPNLSSNAMFAGTVSGNVAGGSWIASQAEAEAGTNNDQVMTPLRVKQAIDAQGGYNLGIGVGQSWVNVLASRSANTIYQNTTGKPIQVSIAMDVGTDGNLQASTDSSSWINVARIDNAGDMVGPVIIPNNHYYRVSANGTLGIWAELR